MHQFPESLSTKFRHERSVSCAARLLEAKRQRIRADLQHTIRHLELLVPFANGGRDEQPSILADAADRLGDDLFAALLRQVMEEEIALRRVRIEP